MDQAQRGLRADVDPRSVTLLGRDAECRALDGLLTDALSGRSRVLILRGEAGIGKSALLGHLFDRLGGWRVAQVAGVESEMELAFSGLHQICSPMLDQLERLPDPQREALATVFGLSPGPAPDRFLVGLATLTLLAEVAERQPLVLIADDAQWLDQATAQVLGFVARRLLAERIAIVCAARSGIGDHILTGLPELSIVGLRGSDARALLLANVHGPLDTAFSERVVAESHGSPLALLELPRSGELAGGFAVPDSQPVADRIEQSYARRLSMLPSETQLLVLAAAAEPLGDTVLLQRAIETLGLDMSAVDPAVDAGVFTIDTRVAFAHPLVRSAAYQAATAADRHRVHSALAAATDPETDPDRHAWHRARATSGPDEEVAVELERSAERARTRGGIAAAAAFLQRAVALTQEPARRVERALAAAEASLQAGAFDAALGLLDIAEVGPLDDLQVAQVNFLRGGVGLAAGQPNAATLLRRATKLLEPFDLALARETYLNAWAAAVFAGHPAGTDELLEICRAAQALPPAEVPRPEDMLLDGLSLLITHGHAAAAPILLGVGRTLLESDLSLAEVARWAWLAPTGSNTIWDDDLTTRVLVTRIVERVRDAGAIGQLPHHLAVLGTITAWSGDFASTASIIAETDSIALATGTPFPPFVALRLTALQGTEAVASPLIAQTIDDADSGQGISATNAHWAAAVLYNGLGRYGDATAAASEATSVPFPLFGAMWALPELVEAAARGGDFELARDALQRLEKVTQPSGTDLALGIYARCRALLSNGGSADDEYREAIDRLGRTRIRTELARAHLLYGEYLRRENRRVDARGQLRTAHEMFVAIGMEAFADRARGELQASGEKVRRRTVDTRDDLTAQERQIARLARDGLSNPEIAARLFLSPRTVEWHLHNVFVKLDINSRRDLANALAGFDYAVQP